ncbi:hypothetical protein SAMCCGM7_pC1479 (plasmid) [Sinorhizobium americanum CCGM7]|nr:hypothetical protein SAMCCGM7_pC1479 [Sinorhizobium americanum CCGM7]
MCFAVAGNGRRYRQLGIVEEVEGQYIARVEPIVTGRRTRRRA